MSDGKHWMVRQNIWHTGWLVSWLPGWRRDKEEFPSNFQTTIWWCLCGRGKSAEHKVYDNMVSALVRIPIINILAYISQQLIKTRNQMLSPGNEGAYFSYLWRRGETQCTIQNVIADLVLNQHLGVPRLHTWTINYTGCGRFQCDSEKWSTFWIQWSRRIPINFVYRYILNWQTGMSVNPSVYCIYLPLLNLSLYCINLLSWYIYMCVLLHYISQW